MALYGTTALYNTVPLPVNNGTGIVSRVGWVPPALLPIKMPHIFRRRVSQFESHSILSISTKAMIDHRPTAVCSCRGNLTRLFLSFMLTRSVLTFRAHLKIQTKKIQTIAMAKVNAVASQKGIKMLLSPAKTLDLSPSLPAVASSMKLTLPDCSPGKTTEVVLAMKKMSVSELTKILKLSGNLAKATAEFWKNFNVDVRDSIKSNAKPCIFTYSGAAYQGLRAADCSREAVMYMQENLRILDAVYGVLRPLDQIQPYRLELNTKSVLPDTKLSSYWSDAVTRTLAADLDATHADAPILLNLASDEYSVVVDASQLPVTCRYVKAVFWEDGRVVSVHAKRARGLMVRYLAEHQIFTMEGIKEFAEEGYQFVESKSDDATLIFDRPKQPKKITDKRTTQETSSRALTAKRAKR